MAANNNTAMFNTLNQNFRSAEWDNEFEELIRRSIALEPGLVDAYKADDLFTLSWEGSNNARIEELENNLKIKENSLSPAAKKFYDKYHRSHRNIWDLVIYGDGNSEPRNAAPPTNTPLPSTNRFANIRGILNPVLANSPEIKGSIEVFDPIEMENISLTYNQIKEDKDNIYFKLQNTDKTEVLYQRYPREQINNNIREHFNIKFECKKKKDGTPIPSDVFIDKPYYLIPISTKYLVPLEEIKGVLESLDKNCYELVSIRDTRKDMEKRAGKPLNSYKDMNGTEELHYVTSYDTIVDYSLSPRANGKPSGLNGNEVNIVNGDHCQENTNRLVHKLLPFVFKNVATGGSIKKRRRSTKKIKKSRRGNKRTIKK